MAGGRGTRFWPLSRKHKSKQVLRLIGNRTMIQEAVIRLLPVILPENIYIVTGTILKETIRKQVPLIPPENILVEPVGRNTAPCIGFALIKIMQQFKEDPIIVVTPSDHIIEDVAGFQNVLRNGIASVSNDRYIATLGIMPTNPETGYGYIHIDKKESKSAGLEYWHVREFIEKPDFETAKKFLNSGEYLWNSGMFIFSASTMLAAFQDHLPTMHSQLMTMMEAGGKKDEEHVTNEIFSMFERISIDYGIMEKAKNIIALRCDFGWCDMGSWGALYKVFPKDKHGNVIIGHNLAISTENTIIFSPEKFVATVGLRDIIVVETEDATLVCHRDFTQDVNKIVNILEGEKYDNLI
ncbi:MAG: hypothetical protein A2161_04705 [Candidatus Schekmanbacteria bacterium RBG_13_48_7]|uniref:mannose-1-phosphate guanylyltransferase n=1 Tax=Candidatus Schekmanbacteria bacterium RBG_13_48_7 TaxID=1817878 RepID=A0A1F7RNV0_9BACT|nr:MAG: hypothetical protein A2161_04705 [Candidatus Schekmanbacteria bacterium RBG_13_48_7]